MNIDIVAALITGIFGIVAGALVAYVGAVVKFRKDLEAEYDKDLRSKRLESYKNLWKHLQLVARYDRPKPLNIQTITELTNSMRQWYFEEGGLYLSEAARETYFDLKKAIHKIMESNKYQTDELLDKNDHTDILEKASLLRASLTKDVGTRKSSPIADS
jgi:hypothetical protein